MQEVRPTRHATVSVVKPLSTTLWGDRAGLFKHKAQASPKATAEMRANLFRSDLKVSAAEELDARHSGSTFVQELASDCKYVVLESFLYANLFYDFELRLFVGFIARESSGLCTQSSFETSDLIYFFRCPSAP